MKKILLLLLLFLLSFPQAEAAEEVNIHAASPQEIQEFLLERAKENGLTTTEQSSQRLVLRMDFDDQWFDDLWGKDAYLLCVYRFDTDGTNTQVSYETQAINGTQISPFTIERLGDYQGRRLGFAQNRLITTIENLSMLRTYFEGIYLYGLVLGMKIGDNVFVEEVLPHTPCEEAGIRVGDRILELCGKTVKDQSDFELFYHYLRHELTATPLKIRLEQDGKKRLLSVTPHLYTAEELAVWRQENLGN